MASWPSGVCEPRIHPPQKRPDSVTKTTEDLPMAFMSIDPAFSFALHGASTLNPARRD
jgi:hypothetical protein